MGIKQFSNPTAGFRNLFNRAEKFDSTGKGAYIPPVPKGHTATGGIIAEYTDPGGTIYRSHTFENSGTFAVSALGNIDTSVDVLLVGGGGGGGNRQHGAGGGAGSLHYSRVSYTHLTLPTILLV